MYQRIFSFLIIVSMLIGLMLGPEYGEFFRPSVPFLLALIIFLMSLSSDIERIDEITKNKDVILIVLILNFLLMPILCWILAKVFLFDHPDLATGLILVGCAPIAVGTTLWIGLLDGDVPLVIALVGVTTLLTPILLPILMLLLAGTFVKVNALDVFKDLVFLIVIPVSLSIFIKKFSKIQKESIKPYSSFLSGLALLIIVFTIIAVNVPNIQKFDAFLSFKLSLVSFIHVFFGFLIGLLISLSRRYGPIKRDILLYTSGSIKNMGLAMTIAILNFKTVTSLPAAVDTVFQVVLAVLVFNTLRYLR